MNDVAAALLVASPWLVVLAVGAWRMRDSRELDEVPADPLAAAPLVSVIVPARNEAANIGPCVRSVLASTYRALEVIVIDDHSTDGTGDRARAVATDHGSVLILSAPELPRGWFGKPWACRCGAAAARGEILCFADADTRHGPELLVRSVNAMQARELDMLSVIGRQELGSFWERVVQPVVFGMLGLRYGGTERVNRSPHRRDKIANGQCLFLRRAAYEAVGGHVAVRDQVAEDLALAQRLFTEGRPAAIILGRSHLTTRMYTSLGEIVAGWRKNVFIGGREATWWGGVGRLLFPVLIPLPAILALLPVAVLAASPMAGGPAWLTGGAALATAGSLGWWTLVCHWLRAPRRYALAFPLGAAVFLVIAVLSVASGRSVRWKGRRYDAPSPGA